MTRLYHYTCAHAWEQIAKDKKLRPFPHPYLSHPLIWLSDLHVLDHKALGLTSDILDCDRGEVRIAVDVDYALPWKVWANGAGIQPYVQRLLEVPPVKAEHWWVCPSWIELPDHRIAETETALRRAESERLCAESERVRAESKRLVAESRRIRGGIDDS